MAGKKKDRSGVSDGRLGSQRRFFVRGAVVLALIAGVAVGMKTLERWVLRQQAESVTSIRIVLADRPVWMPASLAEEISQPLLVGEDFDNSLCRRVHSRAARSPWIRKVRSVRKYRDRASRTGVVEVRAEYRQPCAWVAARGSVKRIYVDAEGVRLPARQAPRLGVTLPATARAPARQVFFVNGAPLGAWWIHYVEIYGVRAQPPEVGQQWAGQDIADALKLVRLFRRRPYWNQIAVVDVRNYAHRISRDDAPFLITARISDRSTKIMMDRFPLDSGDYVIPLRQAMKHLDDFFADHGRVAGVKEYLDLRYDRLHVSIH